MNIWTKLHACIRMCMIFSTTRSTNRPGHPPCLNKVFAVPSMGSFLHADSEDSDQTGRDALSDLSLCWAQSFCWFLSWGGSYLLMHYPKSQRSSRLFGSYAHSFKGRFSRDEAYITIRNGITINFLIILCLYYTRIKVVRSFYYRF